MKPNYSKYFTQGVSPYLDWSFIETFDMSWIDDLNTIRAANKSARIAADIEAGRDPEACHDSDEDLASKDFDSVDFPLSHDWPREFSEKYLDVIKDEEDKISEIIKTAEEVFKAGDLVIYLDCEDDNHYFSAPCYGNGSIEIIAIDDDSEFDSAYTAVYAFVNDYRDWEKEHGEAYKKSTILSKMDSMRQPKQLCEIDVTTGCLHEDLGSLGYKHGETVECPFCGKMAEVW